MAETITAMDDAPYAAHDRISKDIDVAIDQATKVKDDPFLKELPKLIQPRSYEDIKDQLRILGKRVEKLNVQKTLTETDLAYKTAELQAMEREDEDTVEIPPKPIYDVLKVEEVESLANYGKSIIDAADVATEIMEKEEEIKLLVREQTRIEAEQTYIKSLIANYQAIEVMWYKDQMKNELYNPTDEAFKARYKQLEDQQLPSIKEEVTERQEAFKAAKQAFNNATTALRLIKTRRGTQVADNADSEARKKEGEAKKKLRQITANNTGITKKSDELKGVEETIEEKTLVELRGKREKAQEEIDKYKKEIEALVDRADENLKTVESLISQHEINNEVTKIGENSDHTSLEGYFKEFTTFEEKLKILKEHLTSTEQFLTKCAEQLDAAKEAFEAAKVAYNDIVNKAKGITEEIEQSKEAQCKTEKERAYIMQQMSMEKELKDSITFLVLLKEGLSSLDLTRGLPNEHNAIQNVNTGIATIVQSNDADSLLPLTELEAAFDKKMNGNKEKREKLTKEIDELQRENETLMQEATQLRAEAGALQAQATDIRTNLDNPNFIQQQEAVVDEARASMNEAKKKLDDFQSEEERITSLLETMKGLLNPQRRANWKESFKGEVEEASAVYTETNNALVLAYTELEAAHKAVLEQEKIVNPEDAAALDIEGITALMRAVVTTAVGGVVDTMTDRMEAIDERRSMEQTNLEARLMQRLSTTRESMRMDNRLMIIIISILALFNATAIFTSLSKDSSQAPAVEDTAKIGPAEPEEQSDILKQPSENNDRDGATPTQAKAAPAEAETQVEVTKSKKKSEMPTPASQKKPKKKKDVKAKSRDEKKHDNNNGNKREKI